MTQSWAKTKTRHGTTSGARLHATLGEDPCNACAKAKSDYDARWSRTPERTRISRRNARAQQKAYSALSHLHPEEYRELYDRFKAELVAEEA